MTLNTKYLAGLLGFLFTLFIALTLSAQEKDAYVWPVKLQKDYSKTYPVGSETIALMNRYGSMKIEAWDKNEVLVEAHITVGANTNEYANRMLELISVSDEKKDNRIEFFTKVENNWTDNNGAREIRIDYMVHLPASAKLYAENHYGPLTIGDHKGEAELVCKYGTLTAGKLANCRSVAVEYGKAKIESLTDSRIWFRYSRVDIDKLSGRIVGGFDYCSSVDMPIDNALKELELRNNYTSLYLLAPKDFSADYDISTNNARVTGKNDLVIREETGANAKSTTFNGNQTFNSNHKYSGSLGKGGGTTINIKSNYGNIRML